MLLIVIGMISVDKVVEDDVADRYRKSLSMRLFSRETVLLDYLSVTFCIRGRKNTFGLQLLYDIRRSVIADL